MPPSRLLRKWLPGRHRRQLLSPLPWLRPSPSPRPRWRPWPLASWPGDLLWWPALGGARRLVCPPRTPRPRPGLSLRLRPTWRPPGLQVLDLRSHAVIAHGLVSTRRRPELRPVEGYPSEGDQPGLGAEGQHLDEQVVERQQVTPPEPGDRPVVRRDVGAQPPEGHVHLAAPLHLPGGGQPDRVGVDQELQHHLRVVGRGTVGPLIGGVDRREVEHLVDRFRDEPGGVVFGQPVIEGRGKKERLVLVVVTEGPRCPGWRGDPSRRIHPLHLEERLSNGVGGHTQNSCRSTDGSRVRGLLRQLWVLTHAPSSKPIDA